MKKVIYIINTLEIKDTNDWEISNEECLNNFKKNNNIEDITQFQILKTDKNGNFHLEKDKDGNVIVVDNIVDPIVIEDKPSQVEIDFAEYVLATEDRIAQLESKINGGAV